MANVANVLSEKSGKNQRKFDVITLSSDEEESGQGNKDLNFLFKRFILACRPHVPKETIKDARSLFTEVQGNLAASHHIHLVEKLERYCKEIKKQNADLYLNLVCRALDEEKSQNNGVVLKSVNVSENINKVAKSVTFCDVSGEHGLGPSAKLCTNQKNTSTPDISTTIADDMPSTSSVCQDTKTKGKISTKTLSSKQKNKLATRLKQRLKEISNEIKILNRAELTLEEMDMCDSTYIQENRLKKKFEKTWNKLCKILGRPPNTGRVVEKPIRASSTGYSMIDKAVAKFLKEKPGLFPDYFDIRDIVLKTNQTHDLRMSPQVMNGIIADIFTDIGNKLQRRRERDLLFNFGSHVLDDFKAEDDPALSDEDLARQLEKNRRISKRKLKQVYAKYTHLERYQTDDKSRKSGSSMVNGDMSRESGTSDDEQDHDRSRNHNKYARLDHKEVMGKSKMRTGSSSIASRGIDRDISSESSSSDNEQNLSRIENDSIVIEDSDVPTSQEFSFTSATAEISTDMSLSTSHVEQLLSNTDCMEASLNDSEHPESPTFPLTCPIIKHNEIEKPEQTVSTFYPDCSNDKTRTNEQTFSSSSDCEIINNPNEQKQLVIPAKKPFVSETQANSNYDCEIVNEPTEQLVTTKLLDEPVNESVFDKPNTNDDCEIVDDPKQQLITMTLDEPTNEPSANKPHPNTGNECLIIDDDQEDPPATCHSKLLKIPTSAPSDELIKTLNVLREVFQMRSVDQSRTHESNTNSVNQTIPDRVFSSEDRDNMKDLSLKPGNLHSDSQTNISKPWSSQGTSDNCGNSEPECVTLVSDDIIMPENDQRLTSDSLKDNTAISHPSSPKGETNTIPSTTSNAPSKYSEAKRNSKLNQPSSKQSIEVPSTRTITSNSCHSPSSSKPASTSETSNVLNSRKRKATTELTVQISKSSVKCLEQIAWALKNKKLKLPDDWVNSNKAENNSHASLSKPATSKESSTVRTNVPASSKPTMSKGSTTQTLSENNSQLANGNTKIDLQHRQVFREKTLNALKVPTKPACDSNVNGGIQSAYVSSSNKTVSNISLPSDGVDNKDELEVIIIDD